MIERREFIGRLITAGPTRTMTGEPGGYVVTAEAIRAAVDEGLFRGLACFADHAPGGPSSSGNPSIRRLVGVWNSVSWDEEAGAAVGRLAAYETAETRPVLDLLDQWLDDHRRDDQRLIDESSGPDVGVSIVFYPRLAGDGRTVRGIAMVESADLVMFPASEGSRIVGRVDPGRSKEIDPQISQIKKIEEEKRGYPQISQIKKIEEGEEIVHRLTSHSQSFDNSITQPPNLAVSQSPNLPVSQSPNLAVSQYPAITSYGRFQKNGQEIESEQSIRQESEPMKQKTETTDLRRVALVRGGLGVREWGNEGVGEMGSGGAGGQGSGGAAGGAPNSSLDTLNSSLGDWLEAMTTAAATAVIRSSGLPAAVQERLAGGRYESAEEVYAAVERARDELAALNEAGVVRLGGRPPRSSPAETTAIRGIHVRDGLDEARDLVGFFFGAAGSPTPPPNLRSFGDLYVALTGDIYFRGTFDGDRVMFSGATTATLPDLAVDAMNRVIVEQFQALDHYRWYERIAAVEPNDGRLHDMKWITLGGIGSLPAVAEGASYTELSVSDAKETASFVKRGGYVGITREMIKNGDIMQLQAIPRALASAAVRTRSAAVSALFTANGGVGPTLAQDSTALFHTADHANLLTTALGTDATAWRAARAECFQHAELTSGKPLGIFPRFLLVPAELYDVALSILGYGEGMPTTYTPEAQSRGFADPRPIPLVVPDWTDATDWAYIVDPAVFPVIQMSYSQAPGGRQHPAPELFAVTGQTNGLLFTNDTLPIKVRDEFAVGVNGPRGIGKRNVTGS